MRPVQFVVGKDIVRGYLHVPKQLNKPVPGILIIPGFADTAVGPHNMHVQMARALQDRGFVVLRFDYRGQGESNGEFELFTLDSGLMDARAAIGILKQCSEVDRDHLGIIGYSLGGLYAVALATQFQEIKALGLLAPVAYPESVFRAFFTSQQLLQADNCGWIDWMGWKVGGAFLQNLNEMDVNSFIDQSEASILIFHGTQDTEVPIENAIAYSNHRAEVEWIEGGDHGFSSVISKDNVFHRMCNWFQLQFTAAYRKMN